jgi:NagD protein
MNNLSAEVLKGVKCFLLDMDGTVYLSGKLIDGAREAVERLRGRGRVIFLTNNTSVSRQSYVEKLCGLGIKTDLSDIYTAGDAAIDWLNAHKKYERVFLLGTKKLAEQFAAGGISLCADNPSIVVIGFDTSLEYANLAKACSLIRSGVPFLLTHPDINCPVEGGFIPDVGSFYALIKKSCGAVKPVIICGKPHKPIADGIKKLTGAASRETVMIGDRLSTDMRFAIKNGFKSVLVLSGEADRTSLAKSGLKVDLVLGSIAEL